MRVGRARPRARLGVLLAAALLSAGPPGTARAQHRRPGAITFGQPNVWSLEQAQHLLARTHGPSGGPGALDPNEIAGLRSEVISGRLRDAPHMFGGERSPAPRARP